MVNIPVSQSVFFGSDAFDKMFPEERIQSTRRLRLVGARGGP